MQRYYLIDCWNSNSRMVVWLKDRWGKNYFLEDIYHPPIRIRCFTRRGFSILRGLLQKSVLQEDSVFQNYGEDLWTGDRQISYRCRILDGKKMKSLLQEADFVRDDIEFFNTDINPVQGYFLEQNTYPMAEVSISKEAKPWGGNVGIHTHSSLQAPIQLGQTIPNLTSITIFTDHGRYIPIGDKNPIRVGLLQKSHLLPVSQEEGTIRKITGSPVSILGRINEILQEADPDIVFSKGGDEFLFPQLFQWSQELGIPLLLDREKTPTYRNLNIRSRTFYSYGRVLFKTTAFPLFGRLHIDKRESFFFSEADWEGILEMASFSRLPIQRLARSSPGTAMSAMEDEIALSKNILIPRIKGKAGSIKPLSVLLKTDQGGMTFRPIVGYFENVLEFDFRSLYPSLMDIHNISGETVNCICCNPGKPVPDIPYHTCEKRRGIVSETVSLLIRKRDAIKDLLQSETKLDQRTREIWERKSTALKWCLVTCFGYTGYKNAKYGRREAHEAITAWGRYAITTAKEIAEDMGYRFLHGLTDSLWLVSPDPILLEKKYRDELYERVRERLNLRLLHEATYSWIVFPASKVNPGYAVPTRYYARETNGKIKYRGIALRRKNTPIFVDNYQLRVLDILSECDSFRSIQSRESEFRSLWEESIRKLRNREWEARELVVRQTLGKKAEEMKANSAGKIVAEAISEQGVVLEGGQSIEYIVTNRKTKELHLRYKPLFQFSKETDPIDREFYESLLAGARDEVLGIFFPERDLFNYSYDEYLDRYSDEPVLRQY